MTAVSKTEKGKVSVQRARLLKAQAARAELQLKAETGEYVDAAAVKEAAFSEGRRLRDAMLNIPSRVSPILAAETDEQRVSAILDAEIRQALIDYSDGPRESVPNP